MKRRDFLLSVPALLAAPALAATGAVTLNGVPIQCGPPLQQPGEPFKSMNDFVDFANLCRSYVAKYLVDRRFKMDTFSCVHGQHSVIIAHLRYFYPSDFCMGAICPVMLDVFEVEGRSLEYASRTITNRTIEANRELRELVAETERRSHATEGSREAL